MKYETLETIHDLLKSAIAAADKAYKKAREEYNETKRLVEKEGDDSPELLEVLEQDEDLYKSCREKCSRLDSALDDFRRHEFR